MFVDKAKIYIKGGDGGNGQMAFRREKFVPDGGPWGGDGGKGADIIFEVDEGLRTLLDFQYQKHFKGERGEHGRSKGQHGANATDRVVRVPPGTMIFDDDTGDLIVDLLHHGDRYIVARGGRGGRGNMRFATANNPAPAYAEKGEPGQERYIVLELKVMADVGLAGFPSVGKSTLLGAVSRARPKVADYHFTTLAPNLGVVMVDDYKSFVMADLPGLIEGAHQGAGLGHQFLRHIERTRIIVHVVDIAGIEGRDPHDDWLKINHELGSYQINLLDRYQIIAANKIDLPGAEDKLARFRDQLGSDYEIYPISAVTGEGVKQLIYAISEALDQLPVADLVEFPEADGEDHKVYRYEPEDEGFTVRRENHYFVVESERIEKLFAMTNFEQREAAMRFARTLRKMGVDDELRRLGAVNGDSVRISDYEFEFIEE